MSFKRYQYALPRRSNNDELLGLLTSEGLNLRQNSLLRVERAFFDSFDWRLYGAGLLLFIDSTGGRRRLTLRSLEEGLDIVSVDIEESPCFATDLPDGILRRRVQPVLESRRLLERARVDSRLRFFHLLDDEAKTVARLCIEQNRLIADGTRSRSRLRDRVAVIPVRGFDDALYKLREVFEHVLAWERIQASVFDEALTGLGRRPFDYVAKPQLDFAPQTAVGEAARELSAHLFSVIEANEDGVRHDLDIEFLHDLRVATRRTRSLLGQMKHILAAPQFDHFRNEFAWLGAMTSPVRDADVLLCELPRYAARAGEDRAQGIATLVALVRRQRSDQRRTLLEVLASPRYRRLKDGWRALLNNDADGVWKGGEAGTPVSIAAAAMIRHRHKKVLKRGKKLNPDSSDTAFHELRKDCKKLRYLMEFFACQFPNDEIRPLIKALKGLQDNLGEYQDLCVHSDELARFGEMLTADGSGFGDDGARMLARIQDSMEQRKSEVHQEFAGAFTRFADVSDRKRVRGMYDSAAMVASA